MKLSKYLRNYYYNSFNLKKYDFTPTNQDVIVSFTTVPSRINGIKPTLISLLKQPISAIEINLPRQPLKSDIDWHIPKWLTELKAVRLNYLDLDYGPASKFIPTVERYYDQNPILIVVDDDMFYPSDLVDTLVSAHKKTGQRHTYCNAGHQIVSSLKYFDSPHPGKARDITTPKRIAIIEGCGGYLIRPQWFDLNELKTITELKEDCRKQDDLWISGLLSRHGIEKYLISTHKVRKGIANTLTQAITGDRTEPSNQMLEFFKHDWRSEEYAD